MIGHYGNIVCQRFFHISDVLKQNDIWHHGYMST